MLQVQQGSGDLSQWTQTLDVESAVPTDFRWSAKSANVAALGWQADRPGAAPVVGTIPVKATVGQWAGFTLPANAFLLTPTPAANVAFEVRVTPRDAMGVAIEAASAPVTVNEGPPGPGITFGNLNGSSPTGPIEPGHPVAKFLAYKPLPFDGSQGDAEGLLDLEFSNPGPAATTAFYIRVADLFQVARQADPSAFVPSLTPGETFRVSLALVHQGIVGETDQTWLVRYQKGLSLLVGTQKPGDPYVQYQQPPVLTGATGHCAGEGCGSGSPPHIALLRSNLPQIDMSVAAGKDYLYTGDYNDFDVFTKRARQRVDLDPTALTRNSAAAALAWENGGAANLFARFWTAGPTDFNPAGLATTASSPCDPANPVARNNDVKKTLKYQPGFINSFDVKGNPIVIGYPASGCVNDFYDTRMTFDAARDRFWIVTHARNELSANGLCPDASPKCAAMHKEAIRLTYVGVSKSENPADGFFTQQVDNEYFDWPVMQVNADYAVFSHNDGATMRLRLYDATKMVAGSSEELLPSYTAADFPTSYLRVAKHHGASAGMTYIVSAKGPKLWAYAWLSAHAAGVRPPLLTSNAYADPNGDSLGLQEVAYRDGAIYVAATDGKRILVWQLPVAPNQSRSAIQIANNQGLKWVIKDTSGAALNFDYPSIDVNKHDDIVVSFRSSSATKPNQVRYAVRYHNEPSFRTPALLVAPVKTGAGGGRIDFVTSSVDPSDDETVYFIGRDQDGGIVGSVRP